MYELPASKNVSRCRRLRWQGFLLATLWIASAVAMAAEPADAQQWLERLAKSVRERNYIGTFIYRHQGNIETLRIIHRAGADGEMERLYSLTGAAREVIRDNQKVTCILPEDRAVMVDRRQFGNPLTALVPGDIAELGKSYRLEMVGDGRIADRDAKQVGVSPRDDFRYGYRLWIDEDTGLLLRADLFNEQGDPIEQLMFTELRTPESIPDSALQPQISGEGFTWYQDTGRVKAAAPPETQWRIDGIPAGFDLILHEVRALPGNESPVEHMLYSDGLATVSVYFEAVDPEENFSGHSRMGALNAYGRVVDGFQATVVGEVPSATVSRVGESIRRRETTNK